MAVRLPENAILQGKRIPVARSILRDTKAAGSAILHVGVYGRKPLHYVNLHKI
jgi:hypothetical protein